MKPVRTFEAILDWNGESIDVGKVQFSNDNKYVFILNRGDFDGEPDAPYFTTARSSVYIFDFQTGEFIKKIFLPYLTENIEISGDGKYLQTYQGMYHYGQFANKPVAINIISTESLEIIKTFEPGTYYTSTGFINNENVFYSRKYNSYNYDFYDIKKDSILYSYNLGIIDAMFYSDLIFTENNNYFYKFYRDKNDLSIGGFFKYDYPFFNKIDSLKNFPYVSKKMDIFNNNLFFNDGLRKIYLFNFLQLSSINKFELDSNYFMFNGSTIKFMSNEFIGQTAEISVFNNLGQLVLILHNDLISLPTYEYTLSLLENGTYHIVCKLSNRTINYKFMVLK